MESTLNAFLAFVLLLNFFMLGTSRMAVLIRVAGLQGALLGMMPLVSGHHPSLELVLLCIATVVLKGLFIPNLLLRALRQLQVPRTVEPLFGFVPTLLIAAVGTGLVILFGGSLPLTPQHADLLVVPASFSTILTGFLLMILRVKAITQVIGYLILENGIFIFGLLLLGAMPFLVEIGVLLDLLVGVFVMGITINRIARAFDTVDTTELTTLRE